MRPRIPSVRRPAAVPALAMTGGALALGVGGLYLTGLLLAGGTIESGTTVRGVDIGGLTAAEATRKLERDLTPAEARALPVTVGDRSGSVVPREAGLTFDVPGTVDRAAHTGSDPVSVIGALFRSGGDIEPAVHTDEDASRSALRELAGKLDQKVREGGVAFTGGEVEETAPRTGRALDVDAAAGTLKEAFLKGDTDTATALPARETRPKVGAAEVERAVREFARPAMSAPVALTAGDRRFTIAPEVLGEHLTLKPDGDGRLTPKLDEKGLRAAPAVARPLADLTTTPRDARLRLDGDRVVVADRGRTGVQVPDKALGKAVLPLLTESGADRTGALATRRTEPELTPEKVARLGLKEKVSSYTVTFEPAAYRTQNIGRAAELIDGSLVKPGETWSFNRTVGERTEANGFGEGVIILNDKYTKAAGGGVSSVATTMFNAMFFAGVRPVEYGAHSFYIERYPEGREATVAWGSLDLRFANDSGNALYIQAEATDTSVTVTFLGTKKYDEIKSVTGPRRNVVEPGRKVSTDEECVPQTPLEGFDVTVERVFLNNGREVKRQPFHTHYTPRDEIVCE
ncbi:VanW family protein [Streptomyces sp. NPDC029526]|uniref:VanW family protein n=1 Tax=Streptomyces sp. NPDC029526 TaxID=3155728 RepID=UPI0033F977BD